MRQDANPVVFGLVAALLTGCVATTTPRIVPGAASAPSQVTPREAIAIAQRYCKHQWTPFARNILHGPDANGVEVNTPDVSYKPPSGRDGWWVPGTVNKGIPYKWGGFDDPESFDQGVANGLAGGDAATPAKRKADNAAVSAHAAGVDCSGFVSRCLKLPTLHDSAMLPSVCDVLPSPYDLRAGDVLNIPKQHAILVAGWARPDKSWIYYYENGGVPEWRPALKESPTKKLMALGYTPLRYRGMAHAPLPSDKEVITRAIREGVVSIADPVVGDP